MLDRAALLLLAEKCEEACKDEETLFLAVAKSVFPKPPSDYQPRREPCFSPEFDIWAKRDARIGNLISRGAYLDAVMLILPEGGEGWSLSISELLPQPNAAAHIWWRRGYVYSAKAFSPALALASAALQAIAREEDA